MKLPFYVKLNLFTSIMFLITSIGNFFAGNLFLGGMNFFTSIMWGFIAWIGSADWRKERKSKKLNKLLKQKELKEQLIKDLEKEEYQAKLDRMDFVKLAKSRELEKNSN